MHGVNVDITLLSKLPKDKKANRNFFNEGIKKIIGT